MKVLWSWLKEFADVQVGAEEAAHDLTMAGLEVESVETLPDGEVLLDINLTANRPDCLSMRGVARELSVLYGLSLKNPALALPKPAAATQAKVSIEDPELCPRYTGLVIEGVKVAPSPGPVRRRLEDCGIRSINAIVDATNYVLLETGHPQHAFDCDRLAGGRVTARRAKEGETLTTLDGVVRKLTAEDLVIADAEKPAALAGVMGGADSEIREGTTRILLESAYFDPVSVRRTARRHGLHTEASHRFERGADPAEAPRSLLRTAELILAACPGARISAVADCFPAKIPARTIPYRNTRYRTLIGADVSFPSACGILEKIGCSLTQRDDKAGSAQVSPPSFRPDLEREVDLIEEVCRLTGYDKIPVEMPAQPAAASSEFPDFGRFFTAARQVRRILSSAELNEAVNYSFESSAFNDRLGLSAEGRLTLMNPLDSNQDMMRQSLLPGLLSSLLRNQRFLNTDLGFFEVGRIFSRQGEEEKAAILLSGRKVSQSAHAASADWDFFDLKGLVESVLAGFALSGGVVFRPAEGALFHKGQAAELLCGGKVAGILGRLNPRLQEGLELRTAVYLAEWSMDFLCQAGLAVPRQVEMEKLLPVRRDISLVCAADTDAAALTRHIAGRPEISSVRITDVYQGEKIGSGRMSLTFSVRLKQDSPLTDSRINGIMETLLKDLKEQSEISLR